MKKQEKDIKEKDIKDGAISDVEHRVLRKKAKTVLMEVKAARALRKYKTVRVDYRTWKEVEITNKNK